MWREVAKDLQPGRHVFKLELLSEKNPASSGNEFLFLGIAGSSGVE